MTDETGFRDYQQLKRSIQGFGVDIIVAGDRIYSTNGAVVEAATGQLVGTIQAQGPVAVDPARNRIYYVLAKQPRVEAYTADTLVKAGSLDLPAAAGVRGNLVLVGDSALALCTKTQIVVTSTKALPPKRRR